MLEVMIAALVVEERAIVAMVDDLVHGLDDMRGICSHIDEQVRQMILRGREIIGKLSTHALGKSCGAIKLDFPNIVADVSKVDGAGREIDRTVFG